MFSTQVSQAQVNLPTVSVIVLNFNGKRFLKDCLDSLQSLKYPKNSLEIILVDNASSDGSVEFVQSDYRDVKVIRNDNNYGFAKANNIGAERARGKYIAFLNNDMKVDENWLLDLIQPIIESEGNEVVCTSAKILNWDGRKIDFVIGTMNFYGHGDQKYFGKDYYPDDFNQDDYLLFACGGSMLIDKSVFLDVGGFDEDYFAYFEDVDLGWRLWVLGYKVKFAPNSIAYHKHQGTSAKIADEKRFVLYERNALYTILKNYEEKHLRKVMPAALLLTAKRALQHSCITRRDYYFGKGKEVYHAIESFGKYEGERNRKRRSKILKSLLESLKRDVIDRPVYVLLKMCCGYLKQECLPRIGVSRLIALEDVMNNIDEIMAKRETIQRSRKRRDNEIFSLFRDPLKASFPGNDLAVAQDRLTNQFNILELFEDFVDEKEICDISQSKYDDVVGEIIGSRSSGQTFVCSFSNLHKIQIYMATWLRRIKHDAYFYVKEGFRSEKKIVQKRLPASEIRDNEWLKVEFPPIRNSRNKEYYFYIESPEAKPGESFTIWYDTNSSRFGGKRFQNHEEVEGSLTFRTFCKIGKKHNTISN